MRTLLLAGRGRSGPGMALLACAALLGVCGSARADALYMPLNPLQLAVQNRSRIGCADQLKQIMQAAHTWSIDNLGQPPPSLEVLTNELGSPARLFCPANIATSIPTNWAGFDWSKVDYRWNGSVDWGDPAGIACTCRIHDSFGRVEGSVSVGDYRTGWPLITAGPKMVASTPGEDIRLECRVAWDAFQPVAFQWKREHLEYGTNIDRVINPDDPTGIYWKTNTVLHLEGTNLPGETNATLTLPSVAAGDAFYSVAVSNIMGVSTAHARLFADASLAGCSTNEKWLASFCIDNLRMIDVLRGIWAADHNGQNPQLFGVLTNRDGSSMFGWPEALYCRADKERSAPPDWAGVDFSNTSYEIVSADPADPYAVYCRCRAHGYYVEAGGGVMSRPLLNPVTRSSTGAVEVSYKVFAGRTNLLEASSDMIQWSTLASHSPTNGTFQFTDSESLPRRFYRIRAP